MGDVVTLKTAWRIAERILFEHIMETTGTKENAQAFLGYLPADAVDVWMLTSGKSADTQIEEKYSSDTPCFALLRVQARAICRYASRERAIDFAGSIFELLKNTNNMKEIGNIRRVNLTGLPDEPTPDETERFLLWATEVPMEIIINTSRSY